MSLEIDNISVALFEKIRARFEGVSVGDQEAKATVDPAEARFFNFDFVDEVGNNFGNVTISLVDENSLKIYFGKNLSADLDEQQKAEWYDFLRDMRMFAKRNLLSFDTRDISRSNLNIKDLQQISQVQKPKDVNDVSVTEGYATAKFKNGASAQKRADWMTTFEKLVCGADAKHCGRIDWNSATHLFNIGTPPQDAAEQYVRNRVDESRLFGTTKTSYDSIAPGVRLVIRHSGPIDDTIHGARSRKIHKVYIEDPKGQRFMSPFTHIGGSRALGRHIASGGSLHDDFAAHITGLVDELGKLQTFLRGARNKTFEDGEANDIASAAKERYQKVHKILGSLKGARGYKYYKEQWEPTTEAEEVDTEALRSKFTTKKFDERLEAGLPYAHRAYKSMQQEFEESMDKIVEGTWAVPDNDLAVQHLQELMADVFPAGIDGADAFGALYDIIGDDDLYDRIYDASRGSPEMDVRPIIYDWLKSNMPSVFEKVRASMGDNAAKEPAPTEEPEEPVPAEEPAPKQQESKELSAIRRLAGLT